MTRVPDAHERELADFFENASIGVHCVNADGIILRVNQAELDMLGYTRDDYVGRHIADFHVERAVIDDILTRLLRGDRLNAYPASLRCQNGTIRDVLINSSGLFEDGRFIHSRCFTTDVTERNQALRESEQRFRAMADTAPAMLWITEANGACSFLSRGWYEYTGQRVDEGLGFGWTDVVHPDDREESTRIFREAVAKQEPFSLYHRIRRADGEYRWAIDSGRPRLDAHDGKFLGFIGSVIDVHAQQETKEALRRSRDRFDIVRDAAQVGFWFCDLPFDKLTWDSRVKEHFWLSPDADVSIDTFYDQMHPEDRERTRRAIEDSIAQKTKYDIEYRTVSPEGTVKWIRAIGRSFYDDVGNPIRFDGVTLDITDLKRAAEEREVLLESERSARAEAEHASRMKDEFLATLSHELRTPLNAILGYSQLMRMSKLEKADLDEAVIAIERNARLQAQLIEDLLDMNRIISGKVRLDLQRLDLSDAIEAAIETVLPSVAAKAIRLEKFLDPLAGPVRGDPARIQQVVWNLLSNAVKFTPKGGKIQVALERVNSHVEIIVSDNGEGIAPEFLPHVFDRFRQADGSTTRRHGGLGIGLSIVRQLVELHGGVVRAKSAGLGLGAMFIVALPVIIVEHDDKKSDRIHPRSSVSAWVECEADLAGLEVLVVDDERDGCAVVKRLLEECNAKVETASTAEDGFAALQARRFDILLSDIGMPGEDGYQFIRRVRATPGHNQLIPAIALTAFARSEDRRRAALAGFQNHLAKPVDAAELVAVVASLTGRTGDSRPQTM